MNNWLYLAASSLADAERTFALAQLEQLIIRPALNVDGNLIANVKHLQIGDRVFLAYRGSDPRIALHGIIQQPDNAHPRAAAIDIIHPPESREIAGEDYPLLDGDHLEVIRLNELHECNLKIDVAAVGHNALHDLNKTELGSDVLEKIDRGASSGSADLAQGPVAQACDVPKTMTQENSEQHSEKMIQQSNKSEAIRIGSRTASLTSSKATTIGVAPHRLFDRYLFADYSGGGEDAHAQRNIRLYGSIGDGEPHRLYREVLNANEARRNFSRNALREHVQEELSQAKKQGHRVIFGFDHQYSWPLHLLTLAGVGCLGWREAISTLCVGDQKTNLPPLNIPRRYCRAFNERGDIVFWSPLKYVASAYGIPNSRPSLANNNLRYRLTEQVQALQGNARPKPADAVGGQGEGIVGGQTICGMKQIASMFKSDVGKYVAWWPFDGLNIMDDIYRGKHVGVEIYPSAIRPTAVEQTDDKDAEHSCLHVQAADRAGELVQLMTLNVNVHDRADQIMKEGWIVGMNPAQYENE